jgi:hypothetical protein
MSVRIPAFALALAITLTACEATDSVDPSLEAAAEADELSAMLSEATTDPETVDSTATPTAVRGKGHALFDRLAAAIPAFGGLYRSAPCTIVLVLTDLTDARKAVRIVHEAVAPLVHERCRERLRINVAEGEFTYLQLLRFRRASRPLFEIRGVYAVKIDYHLNQLVFIVESRVVAAAVIEALPRVDIPREAVTFQLGAPLPPATRTDSATVAARV